ncbi:unnamed protein product [Amoebophrya sp. A120]|nr:unnamed protein product [Amoebophrya sp. A120]|eukprot:GSA120T00010652001.1
MIWQAPTNMMSLSSQVFTSFLQDHFHQPHIGRRPPAHPAKSPSSPEFVFPSFSSPPRPPRSCTRTSFLSSLTGASTPPVFHSINVLHPPDPNHPDKVGDLISDLGFDSPASPILFGHSSLNNAPNYIATTDMFNLDNTCFVGSRRCPAAAQDAVRKLLGGEEAVLSDPAKQDVVAKVRNHPFFDDSDLQHTDPEYQQTAVKFHPKFTFRYPLFGPVRVQLREIGYLKNADASEDNTQDPSSAIDDSPTGATVKEVQDKVKSGKFVKYVKTGSEHANSTDAKGLAPVVHFDQRFFVGRLDRLQFEKAIYLREILPFRNEKMGLSAQHLAENGDKALESSSVGFSNAGFSAKAGEAGVAGVGVPQGHQTSGSTSASIGTNRHFQLFLQKDEMAMRRKLENPRESDQLTDDDLDVLNAIVEDYGQAQTAFLQPSQHFPLRSVLYNLHTAKPVDENVSAEEIAAADALAKAGSGGFGIVQQLPSVSDVTNSLSSLASRIPGLGTGGSSGPKASQLMASLVKKYLPENAGNVDGDPSSITEVRVPKVPAEKSGAEAEELAKAEEEQTNGTSATAVSEAPDSAQATTRTATLYFSPTDKLPTDAKPLMRNQSDFFSPICGNTGKDKSRVMELRVDSEDDKNLMLSGNSSGRIHQSVMMVVRNTENTALCLCNGLHKGCSAPGWRPLEQPYYLEEVASGMEKDTLLKIDNKIPSSMMNVKLSSFLDTRATPVSEAGEDNARLYQRDVSATTAVRRAGPGAGVANFLSRGNIEITRSRRTKPGLLGMRAGFPMVLSANKSSATSFQHLEGEPLKIRLVQKAKQPGCDADMQLPRRSRGVVIMKAARLNKRNGRTMQGLAVSSSFAEHMVEQNAPDYPPSLDGPGEPHEKFVRVGAEGPLDEKAVIREATQVRIEPVVVGQINGLDKMNNKPAQYFADQEKRGGPMDEHGQVFNKKMQEDKKSYEASEVAEIAKLKKYEDYLRKKIVLQMENTEPIVTKAIS